MKNEEVKEKDISRKDEIKERARENKRYLITGLAFLVFFIAVSILSYCLGQGIID